MISVIIPVYNAEQYIEKMTNAVLSQTWKDFELLLVNDGSTDESGTICDALALKDKRIHVIHQSNGGSSKARNKGLDHAKGNYIAFFDADDLIEPDMLEKLMNGFDRSAVDIVSCGYDEVKDGIKTVKSCPPEEICLTPTEAYRELFKAPSGIWSNSNCNKLYKAELFRTIRYKEGILGEDIEISARLIEASKGALCLPYVLYHYIHRENSNTTRPLNNKRLAILDTTAEIVARVSIKYPELKKDAYAYDLLWMIFSWNNINESPDQKRFYPYKKRIRRRIRENFTEYYHNSCVTFYMKVMMFAMVAHCYEPVKKAGNIIGKMIHGNKGMQRK
ncbi:MAG: glycosyltransferase [Lachnospiraceae bacterium]|nr:glycosyltransferase [Lachnospiraceae bacterium]